MSCIHYNDIQIDHEVFLRVRGSKRDFIVIVSDATKCFGKAI